jgi:membrane-associated phospholipid phosphatase
VLLMGSAVSLLVGPASALDAAAPSDPAAWLDPAVPWERTARAQLDPLGGISPFGFPADLEREGLPLALRARPLVPLGPLSDAVFFAEDAGGLRSWFGRWGPTLVLMAAVGVAEFAFDEPASGRWTARNDFDSALRRGFIGDGRRSRERASDVSNYLLYTLGAISLVDWFAMAEEAPLGDMIRGDLEAHFSNLLATRTLKLAAARTRPLAGGCALDPDWVSDCDEDQFHTGFWSGHASVAAVMAARVCDRHLNRATPGLGDRVLCATSAVLAGATGLLRLTADEHYATDVIGGWVSGSFFGYALPRWRANRAKPAAAAAAALRGGSILAGDGGLRFRGLQPVAARKYIGVRLGFDF